MYIQVSVYGKYVGSNPTKLLGLSHSKLSSDYTALKVWVYDIRANVWNPLVLAV